MTPQTGAFYDEFTHESTYGIPTQTSGSSQSAFGFTGEPTDANGLVSLRARYYNPVLGQFLSLDPLEGSAGQPLSLDRYVYVQGNPVNLTDPSGLVGENSYKYSSCNQQNRRCDCYPDLTLGESTISPFALCLYGIIPECPKPQTQTNCKVFVQGQQNASGQVWEDAFPIIVGDPGTKSGQASLVEDLTSNCENIFVVGYSWGADSTIIFAYFHTKNNIKGLALMGATLTGAVENNGSVANIWRQTLTNLLNNGTHIYVLEDGSTPDLDKTWSDFQPTANPNYFKYDYQPNKIHYANLLSNGNDPNSTNHDIKLVNSVDSWISS